MKLFPYPCLEVAWPIWEYEGGYIKYKIEKEKWYIYFRDVKNTLTFRQKNSDVYIGTNFVVTNDVGTKGGVSCKSILLFFEIFKN